MKLKTEELLSIIAQADRQGFERGKYEANKERDAQVEVLLGKNLSLEELRKAITPISMAETLNGWFKKAYSTVGQEFERPTIMGSKKVRGAK